jgi:glycine cleavage system transcriptional repressor
VKKPQLLVVTAIGADRPGIVAGVTRHLYELGCNLEDVTSTILRGHFSMVLVVRTGPDIGADEVEAALAPVADELDLIITARRVEDADVIVTSPTHIVSVYGTDRPGIVFRVAQLLADRNVNVTDLASRVVGSEEPPVYALMMEVAVPEGVDIEPALRELAAELDVEVTVRRLDADVL